MLSLMRFDWPLGVNHHCNRYESIKGDFRPGSRGGQTMKDKRRFLSLSEGRQIAQVDEIAQ